MSISAKTPVIRVRCSPLPFGRRLLAETTIPVSSETNPKALNGRLGNLQGDECESPILPRIRRHEPEQGHALKRIMERRELGARCPQSQRGIPALVCRRSGQGGSTGASRCQHHQRPAYGRHRHNTHFIQARFDEVRIANVSRTNDWIKASFDNQKSTGTRLVSYGSVVGPRMITSSLASTATVGTAYTYNTTAVGTDSNTTYTIFNLPGGLQFTPGNGQVTGTPTTAGVFPVSLVVNYDDDDGAVTDSDSNPDQIGSIFPPENSGDRPQVILTLTVMRTTDRNQYGPLRFRPPVHP